MITNETPCEGCPYYGSGYCLKNIAKDTRELLKEQEPKWIDYEDTITGDKFKVPLCGNCESLIIDALYCPKCGKKVKWEWFV